MRLWLLWLAATVLGLAFAGWSGHFPFGFPAPRGIAGFPVLSLSWAMVGSVGVGMLFGAVSAVVFALGQWLVLRSALGVSAWWVLATIGGVAFMHGLGDPLTDSGLVPLISVPFGLVAVIGGAVIGTLQFLLLRRRLFSADRWIAVSATSWALGVMAGSTLVTLTDMDRWANREAQLSPVPSPGW